jgi:hypothetical protein
MYPEIQKIIYKYTCLPKSSLLSTSKQQPTYDLQSITEHHSKNLHVYARQCLGFYFTSSFLTLEAKDHNTFNGKVIGCSLPLGE